MLIDITYDKNRLGFITLCMTNSDNPIPKAKAILNPKFNLYFDNEIQANRLVVKRPNKIARELIPLNKYRNMNQLLKEHPGVSRNGYLNIHNSNPFKPRELIDKYIIENKESFKPPMSGQYIEIYYHIHISSPKRCQIYCKVHNPSSNESYVKNFGTFTEQEENDKKPMEYSYYNEEEFTTTVADFVQFIEEYSSLYVVFLMSIKMNIGTKCPLITMLQLAHYNPQYTEKQRKQACNRQQDSIIKQITNIDEFKHCYFIDMSIDMPSCEYNPYMAWNSVEQADFEQIIDQYRRKQYLQVKLETMNNLNVPLSFVLYEPLASNIHTCILRQYFKKGFMFFYNTSKLDIAKGKLIGGLYNQAPEQYQKSVLTNIAEGDFFSLYGTIIIARNVSYETDKELDTLNPLLVDSTKLAVIPELLKTFLEHRKQLNESHPVEKQALKLIIANVYGLFGSEYYSIYNPACSNYIVEVGRKACEIAKQVLIDQGITKNVLQQQTDSCLFELNSDDIQQVLETKWKLLNSEINARLSVSQGFQDIFDFKFESDKFAHKLIIPKAKNTQISLVGTNGRRCIKVKGDLYQEQQTGYRNDVINKYFHKLLQSFEEVDHKQLPVKLSESMGCLCSAGQSLNTQVDLDIEGIKIEHTHESCYFKLYDDEKAKLEQLVERQEIDQITKDYSIYVKYSNDETRSNYLQKQFGVTNSCRCIFFGDRIMPIHLVTKENIKEMRIPETIANMLRPLKSVLTGESQGTNTKNNMYRKGFQERIDAFDRLNEIELPKEDQCMLRVDSNSSHIFIRQAFAQIHDLILEHPFKSFHEILHREINKMYFDIDSENPINELLLHKAITQILDKLLTVKIEPTIHKCTAFSDIENASKKPKYSHHIVIDIKCTKQLNSFLAHEMDARYMFLSGATKGIFDFGVYKSNNQSLRLPLCFKITKDHQLDKRPFIIQSNSTFDDFIIGNTKHCQIEFPQLIHFDSEFPIDPARLCEKFNEFDITDTQILELIGKRTETNPASWKVQDSRIMCKHEYKCFVCDQKHESDNLMIVIADQSIMINCFSNKFRQGGKHQLKVLYKKLSDVTESLAKTLKTTYTQLAGIYNDIDEQHIFLSIANQKQENRYVRFELQKPTTYVISDMGTGKSQQIKKILEQSPVDMKVLCLSFRKTFSIEFATKYDLQNYMEIKGRLNSSNYKRLIVQVDSLPRYDLSTLPGLLIVDEIESILERIPSCKEVQEVSTKFLKLITGSKNVVYMDGLIEKKTIEYLNRFRNCDDSDVIFNSFSPRSDYQYIVYPFTQYNSQHVLNYFIHLTHPSKTNAPKNVYGMITSKRLGFFIKEGLQALGIKVIFYHGSDSRSQQDIDLYNPDNICSASHLTVKQKHFKNVNAYWKQYQVVLHNSAITAGVSFDHEHFDLQVNVYSAGTTTPLSFFQGSHRVRQLKDKQIVTFLEHSNIRSSNTTPKKIFTKEQTLERNIGINADYNFSKLKQMQLWLHARQECAKVFRTQCLFKFMKRMKYQVIIHNKQINFEDNFQGKNLTPMQMQNLEYNRVILVQKQDLDAEDYIKIRDNKISEQDQQLYDREYLDQQIDEVESDLPHFKLQKLLIKRTYDMTFEQVNDPKLTDKHYRLLWNGIDKQEFRNMMCRQINNTCDPSEFKKWLDGIVNQFRVLRNNGRLDDVTCSSHIGLIEQATQIIEYYQRNEFERIHAIQYIRKAKQKMNERGLINNIASRFGAKTRIETILKHFNTFYNIFMIDVSYNNCKLIFTPITKPMYEYLCFPTPKHKNTIPVFQILATSSIPVDNQEQRRRTHSESLDTEFNYEVLE